MPSPRLQELRLAGVSVLLHTLPGGGSPLLHTLPVAGVVGRGLARMIENCLLAKSGPREEEPFPRALFSPSVLEVTLFFPNCKFEEMQKSKNSKSWFPDNDMFCQARRVV